MDGLEGVQEDARKGRAALDQPGEAAAVAGVKALRSAADAFRAAGEGVEAGHCFWDLGRLHRRLGDPLRAIEDLEAAERELAAAGWNEWESLRMADLAADLAAAHEERGDLAAALGHRWAAVERAQAAGDELAFARHQLTLAHLLVRQGMGEAAIEAAEQALELFSDHEVEEEQAVCLTVLGIAWATRGEDTRSDSCFGDAVEAALANGDREAAMDILYRHAQVARERRRGLGAVAALERCTQLARQVGDVARQAKALRLIARIRADAGDRAAASAGLERALDLAVTAEDVSGQAQAHYQLGRFHTAGDRLEDARTAFEDALGEAEACGDHVLCERVLAALTAVHSRRGDLDAAMDSLTRWESRLREDGDRRERIRLTGHKAQVHEERGALEEAEQELRWLLGACTDEQDAPERVRALNGLGVVLSKRERFEEAAVCFGDALTELDQLTAEGAAPPVSEALLCDRYANSLLCLQRTREAVAQIERGLTAEDLDDRLRARLTVAMGNALAQLGETTGARGYLEQAATMFESQGDHRTTMIIRRATASLSR